MIAMPPRPPTTTRASGDHRGLQDPLQAAVGRADRPAVLRVILGLNAIGLRPSYLAWHQCHKQSKAGSWTLSSLSRLTADDIEVVSAHLQDAVVKAADIHWRPAEKRRGGRAQPLRLGGGQRHGPGIPPPPRGAALRAGAGLQVPQSSTPVQKDQVLNLLAVAFDAKRPARRRRHPDVLRRRPRCGSRSSASRPNWPISARPGPPNAARHMRRTRPGRPKPLDRLPNRVDAPLWRGPLTGDTGIVPAGPRHADTPRQPIRGFRRALCRFSRHQARDRRRTSSRRCAPSSPTCARTATAR